VRRKPRGKLHPEMANGKGVLSYPAKQIQIYVNKWKGNKEIQEIQTLGQKW
jgi:hypothetical protein